MVTIGCDGWHQRKLIQTLCYRRTPHQRDMAWNDPPVRYHLTCQQTTRQLQKLVFVFEVTQPPDSTRPTISTPAPCLWEDSATITNDVKHRRAAKLPSKASRVQPHFMRLYLHAHSGFILSPTTGSGETYNIKDLQTIKTFHIPWDKAIQSLKRVILSGPSDAYCMDESVGNLLTQIPMTST